MLDHEAFAFTLLERDKPADCQVGSELETYSVDHLPFILFTTSSDGRQQNGPGLWVVTLDVSVFGETKKQAGDTSLEVDALIHRWGTPEEGVLDDVGYVQSVEDISLFSATSQSVMLGKHVRQYAGSFDLLIRQF